MRSFENISPLIDKDFTMGCKKRPLEDKNGVTPKRIKTTGKESDSSFGNEEHNGAARKRLSSLSSFQMNLIPEQMAVVNAISSLSHWWDYASHICRCISFARVLRSVFLFIVVLIHLR